MEKAPVKIWISSIDSKLGFHLVQKLRNDHIDLENSSLFIGTKHHNPPEQQQDSNRHSHSQIRRLLNYSNQKHGPLIAKCASQCDVVIVDLRSATQEAEFVIKSIEWMAKRKQYAKTQTQANKKVRVLGIGSHMTWAYDRSNNCKLDNADKEQTISKILAYDPEKEEKVLDCNRNKYNPHHEWNREFQLQKKLLSLNQFPWISACILTAGLIYGADFPSQQIESLVARCYDVSAHVHVYGEGTNFLPTVHIEDFCNHVEFILDHMHDTKLKGQYAISVDDEVVTQAKIIDILLQGSGYRKQIQNLPLYHLSREECLMSQSVPLSKSAMFQHIPSRCHSICQYFSEGNPLSQIGLQPQHLVLYMMEHEEQPEMINRMVDQLETVVKVIKQSEIVGTICQEQGIGHDEVDIHEISSRIENAYLQQHERQNYVLVLTQTLLDVAVVERYNLRKFQIRQHAAMMLGHKCEEYNQYHKREQEREGHQNNIPTILDDKQQNIQSQGQKQLEETPANQKKAQQHRKIDQYLLDNVMGYLAQACFQMRNNTDPDLKSFINQLKRIYDRESNAVNVEMQKDNSYLSVENSIQNCRSMKTVHDSL